jgi:hypothetical protein
MPNYQINASEIPNNDKLFNACTKTLQLWKWNKKILFSSFQIAWNIKVDSSFVFSFKVKGLKDTCKEPKRSWRKQESKESKQRCLQHLCWQAKMTRSISWGKTPNGGSQLDPLSFGVVFPTNFWPG